MTTTAHSQRFADTRLAFGIRLYESGDKKSSYGKYRTLWRFEVTDYCDGPVWFECDASAKMFQEMRSWLERAEKAMAEHDATLVKLPEQDAA